MLLSTEAELFWCLAALCAFKHAILAVTSHRCRTRHQRLTVGRVSRLIVYPVKSMKGVDVQQAQCHFTGLLAHVPDRVWMVTSTKYDFVTARQQPKLVTILTSLHGNQLHLDAPGMETVTVDSHFADSETVDNLQNVQVKQATVWGETIEVADCGDEVSSWISSYLGKPAGTYRLVYHLPHMVKRRCDQGETRWHRTAKPTDKVVFQDGFPFMLMSDSSVDDLNSKLECRPVTMDHFRPNIVATGCTPYDEDDWSQLFIGDAVFTNIKPCQRCVLTTIDPSTGEKRVNQEPLRTLRRYRLLEPEFGQSPCFGINLVLTTPGMIHVGDEIQAIRNTK